MRLAGELFIESCLADRGRAAGDGKGAAALEASKYWPSERVSSIWWPKAAETVLSRTAVCWPVLEAPLGRRRGPGSGSAPSGLVGEVEVA
jgi:hypothetical protein